ncbi:MAG: hypothetical protein DI570_22560 [Phenylobacterium zucineum]|nr:MAG: hypothetical protein DI570_22560 [Phenylobacterium zucineum]
MTWHPDDRPHIQREILARVEAGETVRAICAGPGKPCAETVRNWARADAAGFGAALAAARGRALERRKYGYDEAVAQAVLARLWAGARLGEVLAEPGMPNRRRWLRWVGSQGHIAEVYFGLMRQRVESRTLKMRAGRYRAFDAAVAERLYRRLWFGEPLRSVLRSDKDFPALATLARWRREEPGFGRMIDGVLRGWRRRRARERTRCTPAVTEKVYLALSQGHSLRSISRMPGAPSQQALYNWVRERERFAEVVAWGCHDREGWYIDRIVEAAEQSGARTKRELTRATAPLVRQMTRLRKRPGWKRWQAGAGQGAG